jgi:Ca-activated chloride channel family protein
MPTIDLESLRFGARIFLWVLIAPGALVLVLVWRVLRRRGDVRRLRAARVLPMRERYGFAGDLAFWACVLAAASLVIVAVARPQARIAGYRKASADIVILQDASASMYVGDVKPDRWRRSVLFLRTFAEALSWQGDRVALALFASTAAPQVRLTKDPNALFFFIDHLGDHSPFTLENVTTWDTNIEEGIRWGLRLIEADEKLFGKSGNPKAFVVVTDGQSWTGSVATALRGAKAGGVPVYVVGVGTTAGGLIPEPRRADGTRPPAVVHSVLDRASLVRLAVEGGGEYFELGDDSDGAVAFRLIERLRGRSAAAEDVETLQELYPQFLMAAAVLLCAGTLLLQRQTEVAWQATGALAVVLLLASVL